MTCITLLSCNLSWANPIQPSVPSEMGVPIMQPWTWKLQPQVGERYDLRFFARHEVTVREPVLRPEVGVSLGTERHWSGRWANMDAGAGTGPQKNPRKDVVDTTIVDTFLSKAVFRMDILESGPDAWKARLTCLDSSFALVHDRVVRPAFQTPSDIKSEAQRESRRRVTFAAIDARFRRAIKGAQVSFSCDSNGRFQRWYGDKAWAQRLQKSQEASWDFSRGDQDASAFIHPALRGLGELQTQIQWWLEGMPTKPVTVGEAWSFTTKPEGDAWLPAKVSSAKRTLTHLNQSEAEIQEDVQFSIESGRPRDLDRLLLYMSSRGSRRSNIRVPARGGFPLRTDQMFNIAGYNTDELKGKIYRRQDVISTEHQIISCTLIGAGRDLGKGQELIR